ncbi:MAG: DUF1177 domain-containing protein, partial [Candidatus Bathyarchaeia archaeon]
IKIWIQGSTGKLKGGPSLTLGVIGRLGGVGARPEMNGLASDADGAITALSCALKLADMRMKGSRLDGDVHISTHICSNAPIIRHEPAAFMGAPVDMSTMSKFEVSSEMDAILSVDTTRGNRIVKFRGFAITPTVMQGYILRVSDDLLDIYERVAGGPPRVVPVTTQDLTPYENGLYHLNSILQPACATNAPVVGVALTSETVIPGCGTGANQLVGVEEATRFCIEVAKEFGGSRCSFYDPAEYEILLKLYGPMTHLCRRSGNRVHNKASI